VNDLLSGRILIVDDEADNVTALVRILEQEGYENVLGITDPREALATLASFKPDLLVLDLRMPHTDGFAILEALAEGPPVEVHLPVLVLTANIRLDTRERALSAGARDFVAKPFEPSEVLLRIRNLLETRLLHLRLQETNRRLEERVRTRTRDLHEAQYEILMRLARAAEYRDDATGHHAQRVGDLAASLLRRLGASDLEVELIRAAATLHDVGKIGIPDAILMKPGALTPEEYAVIRSHVDIGERILSGSRFPILRMAAEIAGTHHERWDGDGYRGLKGEAIPLVGRVVAVADAFDSLTHHRPYHRAVTPHEAVDRLAEASGTHFDPEVIEALMGLRDEGVLALPVAAPA
jgi:putative two-component system response regulator